MPVTTFGYKRKTLYVFEPDPDDVERMTAGLACKPLDPRFVIATDEQVSIHPSVTEQRKRAWARGEREIMDDVVTALEELRSHLSSRDHERFVATSVTPGQGWNDVLVESSVSLEPKE